MVKENKSMTFITLWIHKVKSTPKSTVQHCMCGQVPSEVNLLEIDIVVFLSLLISFSFFRWRNHQSD